MSTHIAEPVHLPPFPPPSETSIGFRRKLQKRNGIARGTAVLICYSQPTADRVLEYFNKTRSGTWVSEAKKAELGTIFGTGMTTAIVIKWNHGPVKNEYDGPANMIREIHKAVFGTGRTDLGNHTFSRRFDLVRYEIDWDPTSDASVPTDA